MGTSRAAGVSVGGGTVMACSIWSSLDVGGRSHAVRHNIKKQDVYRNVIGSFRTIQVDDTDGALLNLCQMLENRESKPESSTKVMVPAFDNVHCIKRQGRPEFLPNRNVYIDAIMDTKARCRVKSV